MLLSSLGACTDWKFLKTVQIVAVASDLGWVGQPTFLAVLFLLLMVLSPAFFLRPGHKKAEVYSYRLHIHCREK